MSIPHLPINLWDYRLDSSGGNEYLKEIAFAVDPSGQIGKTSAAVLGNEIFHTLSLTGEHNHKIYEEGQTYNDYTDDISGAMASGGSEADLNGIGFQKVGAMSGGPVFNQWFSGNDKATFSDFDNTIDGRIQIPWDGNQDWNELLIKTGNGWWFSIHRHARWGTDYSHVFNPIRYSWSSSETPILEYLYYVPSAEDGVSESDIDQASSTKIFIHNIPLDQYNLSGHTYADGSLQIGYKTLYAEKSLGNENENYTNKGIVHIFQGIEYYVRYNPVLEPYILRWELWNKEDSSPQENLVLNSTLSSNTYPNIKEFNSGWHEVRFTMPDDYWFYQSDNLLGDSDRTIEFVFRRDKSWNIGYFDLVVPHWDEMKIESGNGQFWVIFKKSDYETALNNYTDTDIKFPAIATHNDATELGFRLVNSSATIFSASNAGGDGPNSQLCYYAENNVNVFDKTVLNDGGVSIYIRKSTVSLPLDWTSGLQVKSNIESFTWRLYIVNPDRKDLYKEPVLSNPLSSIDTPSSVLDGDSNLKKCIGYIGGFRIRLTYSDDLQSYTVQMVIINAEDLEVANVAIADFFDYHNIPSYDNLSYPNLQVFNVIGLSSDVQRSQLINNLGVLGNSVTFTMPNIDKRIRNDPYLNHTTFGDVYGNFPSRFTVSDWVTKLKLAEIPNDLDLSGDDLTSRLTTIGKGTGSNWQWKWDMTGTDDIITDWVLVDHIPPLSGFSTNAWFARIDNLGHDETVPPQATGSSDLLGSRYTVGGTMESIVSGYNEIKIQTVNNYEGSGSVGYWVISKETRDFIVTQSDDATGLSWREAPLLAAWNGDHILKYDVYTAAGNENQNGPILAVENTGTSSNRKFFYMENSAGGTPGDDTSQANLLSYGIQIWIRRNGNITYYPSRGLAITSPPINLNDATFVDDDYQHPDLSGDWSLLDQLDWLGRSNFAMVFEHTFKLTYNNSGSRNVSKFVSSRRIETSDIDKQSSAASMTYKKTFMSDAEGAVFSVARNMYSNQLRIFLFLTIFALLFLKNKA